MHFVVLTSILVATDFVPIFQEEYRALRPRAPMPPIAVRFRRFTSLNTTHPPARRRRFASASPTCWRARRSPSSAPSPTSCWPSSTKSPSTQRKTCATSASASCAAVTRQTELIRHARGSKRFFGPEGRFYHLEEVFDSLNVRFFGGLLGRPELTWSEHHAKRSLGHYDAAHNTIVVSRVFDRPSSPRYAIEYLLYHEMLHLKHPVRMRGLRRCVHSREFKAEEALFPQLAEALAFIKRLQ